VLGRERLLLLVSSLENSVVKVFIFDALVHHTELLRFATCLEVAITGPVIRTRSHLVRRAVPREVVLLVFKNRR